MCDSDTSEYIIGCLKSIEKELGVLITGRPPIDAVYMISSTVPYVVDYKARKHLFAFTNNTLTLTIEDWTSTFTATQFIWTNISFAPGTRIFASGQSSNVPIFVRATDESVP